mgnify:CR=1 FL=1
MQQWVSMPSLKTASSDVPAGIVVFLVALPLCLGIALASGAPLFSGIIAGIIGGIVVTIFSGSELSVSGPAAGLASIVAAAITAVGDYPVFLMAVVLAGGIQLAIALMRAGTLGNFIPHCVIKGMLAAIGITIVLKQIPHAVGYASQFLDEDVFLHGAPWLHVLAHPLEALNASVVQPGAIAITLVCLGILIAWELPPIRGTRWSGILPGALVAVVAGTLMNLAFRAFAPEWALTAERQHLVAIPVLDSIAAAGSLITLPDFGAITRPDVWTIAFTIAAIASIETVLCVEATDKMDPQRRIADVNRELRAQGIGNLSSGLVGGLPITAVIVRSSANVYSGAKTRTSAFVHGLLLLLAVLLIPLLLNEIPLACLAAVLLMVGYKLSSIKLIRSVWREGFAQFVPFIVTVAVIVATDILVGVGTGLLVSVFFLMRAYHRSAMTLAHEGSNYLLRLNKDMSFVHKSKLKETLRRVPDNSFLIVDGIKALYIDHDIYETLKDFEVAAKHRGITMEYHHYFGKEGTARGRLSPASA